MHRNALLASFVVLAGALVLLATLGGPPRATAQQGTPYAGQTPAPGAVGLLVATQETSAADLITSLASGGCEAQTLGLLRGGTWLLHLNGAPAAVNSSFPALVPVSDPFFVRCTDRVLVAGPPPASTPAPTAVPTASATSEPSVTYPQPGSPTDLGLGGFTTIYTADSVRFELHVSGTSSGSGVLTQLRFCRNPFDDFGVCWFDAPPPGTTTADGSLSADYIIEGLPPVGLTDDLTFQICNDAGCGGYKSIGEWRYHQSQFAEFHALATGFVGSSLVGVFILDPQIKSLTLEYSDGTTETANCSGLGRCGSANFDETTADSVTITARRLNPDESGSTTLPLR